MKCRKNESEVIYIRAGERTMRCREMKLVVSNKIYERDFCRNLIQNQSEISNDQE